ncbi:MAG: glycosyltransferase family 4 protein [Pseudomonas sp.]|jgi:Fuc2NAc and GlcNAc transferase|nr:glycosyltransferase family 4 protein [Pseudomonas sp.]MDD2222940.1 glycosyltransferase family 4 protein [Pseudomonas sp.]
MSDRLIVAVVFIAAFMLTWLLRRYALAGRLMDIPNERSSHSIPTPRGGGVAIVLIFLTVLLVMGSLQWLPWRFIIGIVGAGACVAVLGFLDDHGHIAVRWRLLGHFSSAAWALYWLGGLPPLLVFGYTFDLGVMGHVLAAVYIVWLLNLYNFMDGIDGLASVEAICVGLGGAVLYLLLGADSTLVRVPMLFAAAVAGFLCWNFPPARIFMGDVGSCFLGLVLAVLSLQAAWFKTELLWAWIILLGVFVVDATFTLLRRLVRGDKVYEAHCSHAYQYAARHYAAHSVVTLAVMLINLVWLLPMAVLVGLGYLDGLLGVIMAYLPLVLLAIKFKAGQLEKA